MTDNKIEISVRGVWVTVPFVPYQGKAIVFRGKWIRTAVIHDEAWQEEDVWDPATMVRILKAQKTRTLRADIFTCTWDESSPAPQCEHTSECDSVAAASIASFNNWWERLPQETRKNVRRAQKRGVVVKVSAFDDELIKGIIGVNDDSPLRQGRRNDHYGKTFAQVKKDQSAFLERSDFICAYCEGEMIGFVKIVYRGGLASILNLAVKASHHDKRPANILIAEAVKRCETKGISRLTYGMFNYGNKRDSPLREFKSRNGFEELLVPRLYIPLTLWGALCLRAHLHRGLLGILPHTVINLVVSIRSKCYKWLYSISRQAGVAQ